MKRFIETFLFVLFSASAYSFNYNDSIQIHKTVVTYFLKDGKKMGPKHLMRTMKYDSIAYMVMERARTNYDIANGLSFSGGFLIGYTLGAVIAGKDLNFTTLGIGAGLICLSIPLNISYLKLAKKAIGFYNSGIHKSGFKRFELKLGLTVNRCN